MSASEKACKQLGVRLVAPGSGGPTHFSIGLVLPVTLLRGSRSGDAKSRSPLRRLDAGEPGAGFLMTYSGLSGNLPKQYQNTAWLWEGALPNTQRLPLETQPVATDLERGSVRFEYGLTAAAYCVTYQVGADATRSCALAQINPGDGPPVPAYVDIKISKLTESAVTVVYTTLPGYLPRTNGNWVALWPGYALPYTAPKPLAWQPVGDDFTQGFVTLNAPFTSELSYTLAYFLGPAQSTAAAVIYFQPTEPGAAPAP